MKYHIVGIEKCGTHSLQKYLRDGGYEVIAHEWLYCRRNGPTMHDEYYAECQPIIITRDPIERFISDYHWREQRKQPGTLKQIIQGSYYDYWIRLWSKQRPIILRLEDMSMIDGFPHVLEAGYNKPEPIEIVKWEEKQVEKFINESSHE